MRLNHFIAKSGYTSRRKADSLIRDGKVSVNGKKVTLPFFRVLDKDWVRIGRETLRLKNYLYFVLNKPKGVTSTLGDRFAGRKVVDLLPKGVCSDKRVYPVGRLDKNSWGLLIMTNDGDFCYRVTHPKFSVEKEYLVKLRGNFKSEDYQKVLEGIRVDRDYLKVERMKVSKRKNNSTICRVVVREGKKRHLRRLFEKVGYPVKDLKRIRIGNLHLRSLAIGECKVVSQEKIYRLVFGSNSFCCKKHI